jgi:hypothetical protein
MVEILHNQTQTGQRFPSERGGDTTQSVTDSPGFTLGGEDNTKQTQTGQASLQGVYDNRHRQARVSLGGGGVIPDIDMPGYPFRKRRYQTHKAGFPFREKGYIRQRLARFLFREGVIP